MSERLGCTLARHTVACPACDAPDVFSRETADGPASRCTRCAATFRSDAWRWTLPQGVAAWIAAHVDPPGECPAPDCRAGGIRNLGDGRYTCSNDDCDSRFDRSTAAEVLGR